MHLNEIIDYFPSVQHAFAYGSGVFKQPGLYADGTTQHEGPMIDMIFAVDDPLAWHQEVKTSRRTAAMFNQTVSPLVVLFSLYLSWESNSVLNLRIGVCRI